MKRFIQKTFLLSVLLFLSMQIFAQQKTITGLVNDELGPLIGATVVIEGTSQGVATDIDGKYSIKVDSEDAVLVFSYIGYQAVKKAVKGLSVIDVSMMTDNTQLEELVVIGYGVQKKSHLTGSITRFKTDEVSSIPTSDVANALQGRLSGVTIQNQTGEVGVAPKISIRGGSALNDGSGPLIVVDNFVMEDGLSMINSSDIESIEVLKDASSAAIYGSRAANGVIMITTKQGAEMKPTYTVKYSVGFRTPYKLHELVTPGKTTDLLLYELSLGGRTVANDDLAAKYLEERLPYTDWQNLGLTENPMVNNLQLYVSGGSANLKYTVSGGYISEEGLAKKNSIDKFNFRSRLDIKLSDDVDLGTSISAAYTATERPSNNFLDFTRFPQWMPVYHNEFTSGLTGEAIGTYAHPRHFNLDYPIGENEAMLAAKPYNSNNNSPVAFLDKSIKEDDTYQLSGNAYLNIKILPNLIFRTANSVTLRYATTDIFREKDAQKPGLQAEGTFSSTLRSTMTTDNTLSYDETFGVHGVNVMLGVSAEQWKSKIASLDGTGFPTDYIRWLTAATSFNPEGTGVSLTPEENMFSYFGRANYSLKDKYLISGVLRADGYSLFGANNKWGYFPSVSVGWRVCQEPFMKSIDQISSLKFRAGYGITGDNKLESLATLDLLYSALYPIGGGTGSVVSGLSNTGELIGNPDLGWAKVREFNVGFDLGLFNSKLNVAVDYYYSVTSDMLFKRPVSSISGHKEFWTNQGKVRNKGVELSIESYNFTSGDFKWNTSFNIAADRNRLLGLGGESQIIKTASGSKESYISMVGEKAIQFYGYKTDGVWLSEEDIANGVIFPAGNVVEGGLKVVNVNGDEVLNEKDMTVLGDPYHDFTWGLTNTFSYKGFDLSILFQGSHGAEMINGDAHYNDFKERNPKYGMNNRWINEANPGDGKTPYHKPGAINWMLTDYVVEDASYIALRNISLGYKFPKSIVNRLNLDGIRVYVNADNICFFTPSGYRGINSEYRMTSGDYADPLISGYQRGAFPIATTISAGIDIKF